MTVLSGGVGHGQVEVRAFPSQSTKGAQPPGTAPRGAVDAKKAPVAGWLLKKLLGGC